MESFSSPGPTLLSDPGTLRLLIESLKACGAGRIHLQGKSMLPTLREGVVLVVRSIAATELRPGDIGVFVHRDLLTVHRLIWIRKDGGRRLFIFQGDNNPERETVEAEAILGRVEAYEMESSRGEGSRPVRVGIDRLAFFYRNAHRLHSLLAGWFPAAALPPEGGTGSLPYRLLRALFRRLEPIFSPRGRR